MTGDAPDEADLALAEIRGKRAAGGRPPPQECGDIGMRIASDGTWYYQGGAIGRKPLVKLFSTVLRREDDGRYYLVTPAEKARIEVDDVPFVAVEMQAEGEGAGQSLRFRTNVDAWVIAGPEHPLSFRGAADGSFTPYLLVRAGLEARLARPVYYELADLAGESGGRTGVWSGGAFFPFPQMGTAKA